MNHLPARPRNLLFAPAVRPDLVAKTPTSSPDLVAIDLEDATPVSAKDGARASLPELVDSVRGRSPVTVRVNAADSPWFDDDVAALPEGLAAVIVPKIETVQGLDRIASALRDAGHPNLAIIAGIETALGVADSRELLAHSVVGAAYFGAEDFIADMGGYRTFHNREVAYARGLVALSARLAGVPAFDQVVADFRDHDRCQAECEEAQAMGYTGKLCIHPGQVGIARNAFTPSPAEIDHAVRLLAAYEEATEAGIAAIDFEGRMVDEPVAAQARHVLELADEP
jgi:citrate lyase subunit beta/citryl-CoA lyase